MPVYNAQPFLRQTLDCLLGQTMQDFELVISDNGSTDDTADICRAAAACDPRIRFYHSKINRGAAWNYNRVFQLSRGQYFKWAAADDLCALTFLQKCYQELQAKPYAVVCYSRTQIINAQGRCLHEYQHRVNLDKLCPRTRFVELVRTLRECNAVFGLMRSSVLRRTRLIGDYMGSDVNLLGELALHGPLVELPEFLFFRREHPKASSYDKSFKNQLMFFNPAKVGTVVMPDWRRRYEFLRAVIRAPIAPSHKMFLLAYVFKGGLHSRQALWQQAVQALRQTIGITTEYSL